MIFRDSRFIYKGSQRNEHLSKFIYKRSGSENGAYLQMIFVGAWFFFSHW
jgi:hypothetical protein